MEVGQNFTVCVDAYFHIGMSTLITRENIADAYFWGIPIFTCQGLEY